MVDLGGNSSGATATRRWLRTSCLFAIGAALLAALAVLRIAATYSQVAHTVDEGAHLACGLQWFGGTYTYDIKHTPLARLSIALLPHLDGLRSFGNSSYWQEGVLDLSTGGHYWRNLTLARLGVLPFFVLAVVMIFVWMKRLHGSASALIAVGIFTLQPMVLANSAIATTDIPLAATFLVAVYAFTRWLTFPNWRSALGLGAATGLAIVTKLSTLVFLPAIAACIWPLYALSRRAGADEGAADHGYFGWRRLVGSMLIVTASIVLVIWAAYRFSHAPIVQFSNAPDRIAARVFGAASSFAGAVRAVTATVQLPAPEFYDGLRELRDTNRAGTPVYMFGHIRQGGFWYFYPVGVALKTPLAVLVLSLIGAASLALTWLRSRRDWERLVPLIGVVAILAVCMPTRMDIGTRHVMPVFAFLSMLAAVGVARLWNWSPGGGAGSVANGSVCVALGPAMTLVLLGWLIGISAKAHPDYLSYFNELAGGEPARMMVSSDLDWGQDLSKLASYLRGQHVHHLSIAYGTLFDSAALGMPESTLLQCGQRASGWVAIGENRARGHPQCYPWTASQPVRAYVGKTLRIYYLPEADAADGP